jgi:hypothetical protein
MTAPEIEECINEAERRIRKELPLMRKIFIEVDANGDGRGVEKARAAWAARQKSQEKAYGPREAASGGRDRERRSEPPSAAAS